MGFPPAMLQARFIPASAGNTLKNRFEASSHSVHPRVCGEHMVAGVLTLDTTGSSPRLRGTPSWYDSDILLLRFIPASAGNTTQRDHQVQGKPVHPRVCGEHWTMPTSPAPSRGSSPRLRGTHPDHPDHLCKVRFIPASAGNTRPNSLRAASSAVHPRVCGEHAIFSRCDAVSCGSSPRLRGTRGLDRL